MVNIANIRRRINFSVFRNDVDITTEFAKFIVSVQYVDVFDNKFTPSKMTITYHSFYKPSFNEGWQYNDKIRLGIFWDDDPPLVHNTNNFYVDFIDDDRATGSQYTILSAIETIANLAMVYEKDSIQYSYGYRKNPFTGVITEEGVRLKQLLIDTLISQYSQLNRQIDSVEELLVLGFTPRNRANDGSYSIPPEYIEANPANINEIVFLLTQSEKYSSFIELLSDVAVKYGFFGTLFNDTLQLIAIDSTTSYLRDFNIPKAENILDFKARFNWNAIINRYNIVYFNGTFTGDTVQTEDIVQNTNFIISSNKRINIFNELYPNRTSAEARIRGFLTTETVDNFYVDLKAIGHPEYRAGKVFYLDSSYGTYEGNYRAIRVAHSLGGDSDWTTLIRGYPIDLFRQSQSTFRPTPIEPTIPVRIDLKLTNLILQNFDPFGDDSGQKYDDYLKFRNNLYNTNLEIGKIYAREAKNLPLGFNGMMAFAHFCVYTNDAKNTTLNNVRNPGRLSASGGGFYVFPSWLNGIKAHMHYLYAFTNSNTVRNPIPPDANTIYPRYIGGIWAVTNSSSFGYQVIDDFTTYLVPEAVKGKMIDIAKFVGFENPDF